MKKENLETEKEIIGTRILTPIKISMDKAKKEYYKRHKLGFIKRLKESTLPIQDNAIISIEGNGYWLSNILFDNIDLKFSKINEILIKDSKLKWTQINSELIAVFKVNKTVKEIQKIIKLE